MQPHSPEACVAAFTDALVRRDMASALALLTDDVVFFYSNGTAILGKDAFASLMKAAWQALQDYRYQTVDPRWVARSPAAASVVYGFEWSGRARGEAVGGRGRGTRVLTNDGSLWRIAHEHLSTGERGAEPLSDRRLAEIMAIRDDDIDTSDIPQATEADFRRARIVRAPHGPR
ncbi:MAG TPA: nuclear transport factor 2 family protein, partial [Caulobacteraceae bacterium]|nr:nuclear transport factor 2 family protein [Caulobacteraceae bacterium]